MMAVRLLSSWCKRYYVAFISILMIGVLTSSNSKNDVLFVEASTTMIEASTNPQQRRRPRRNYYFQPPQGLNFVVKELRGGGGIIPGGYNPFGYKITTQGEEFLEFDGSLDSDIGRFLAGVKSNRKTRATIKAQWLEIVRVSKNAQSMRIYRKLEELIAFCLKAGFID